MTPQNVLATDERESPNAESTLPPLLDTDLDDPAHFAEDQIDAADGENAEQDEAFDLLRTLLFDEYREQIVQMRGQVAELREILDGLEQQIHDEEALINTLKPVIAGAIRTNIRDSREEMIEALTPIMAGAIRTNIRDSHGEMVEALTPIMAGAIRSNINESRGEMIDALYPIMGKLVQRAVTEAMRDLVERIDQQMRRTLDIKSLLRRFQARLRGISDAEMTMRDALPLQVDEIFLIHKETGLLLMHLSVTSNEAEEDDSDIISGMLTAINEFTEDAFGRGEEEALNEIQYGGRSILLETAHLVYIAVAIDGYDSSEFRNQMRETMIAIEHRYASALRNYDGDASRFEESSSMLASLYSPLY